MGDAPDEGTAGFRRGLVVGRFYPPHAGHAVSVGAAADACARVAVVVRAAPTDTIPLRLRVDWLREEHRDLRHVEVVGVPDPSGPGGPRRREELVGTVHAALTALAVAHGRSPAESGIDAVFSSERHGEDLARRLGAEHVYVGRRRAGVRVSGSDVRRDVAAHWHHLGAAVRAWLTRRVVVVGAESSGRTTLAAALAEHYRSRGGVWAWTRWVPAYDREIRKLAAPAVEAARHGSPILVCDADPLATALWEERCLGTVSAELDQAARARPPALYLLTDHVGVVFEPGAGRRGGPPARWDGDDARRVARRRAAMTDRFRAVLAQSAVPVVEVTGSPRARLSTAVDACDALLAAGWRLPPPPGRRS